MLRTTQPLLRSSARAIALWRSASVSSTTFTTLAPRQATKGGLNGLREQYAGGVGHVAFRKRYSTKPPLQPNEIDEEREKELGKKKLEAHPESVSSTSTVRAAFEKKEQAKQDTGDILQDVKADLHTVKDTLALNKVPTEPYVLGLAGTLPYLATSISTVFLGWNIRTIENTSSSFLHSIMFTPEKAHQWLQLLEPIQVGYGAVIISFLGAVHWGMEYAEKTPSQDRTRFRYGLGMLAPAVAWPTLLLPVQFALTAQFAAFTFLYFADARAQARGWTPPWYGTYRFVLTFVVGGAIFLSLVGRAKIGDDRPRIAANRLEEHMHERGNKDHEPYSAKWAKLEQEEKERVKKEKEEEEKREKEEKKKKGKKGKKAGKEEDGKKGNKDDKDKEDGGDDEEEKSEDDGDSDEEKSDDDGGDDEEKSDADGGDDEKKDKKDKKNRPNPRLENKEETASKRKK